MAITSKFIINRNNLRYIYVEKNLVNGGCEYFVYDGGQSCICPPEHFQSMFGTDEKMAIEDFLRNAEANIISTYLEDNTLPVMYDNFTKIYTKVNGKDRKNPSIWGYSNTLLKTIDMYNEFIYKEYQMYIKDIKEQVNDYEKEYQKLIRQEQ